MSPVECPEEGRRASELSETVFRKPQRPRVCALRRSQGRFQDADQAPFAHTFSDSPWKVNSLLTEVLGGAPKYGNVTKSWRW